MFDRPIPEGALFYGQTKKRLTVRFDADLRALTIRIAGEVRAMLAANRTPPPHAMPGCKRCSLASQCRPTRLETPPALRRWPTGPLADCPRQNALRRHPTTISLPSEDACLRNDDANNLDQVDGRATE